MISDEEINDLKKTGFSLFTAFILIPAITVVSNVFGFLGTVSIVIISTMFLLTLISFVRRYIFLRKHRRFISNKQWYFQNISFVSLMIWNIFACFLPYYGNEDGKKTIEYHLVGNFNLLLWIPLIIFSFILFTFMVITAKNVTRPLAKRMKEIDNCSIEGE